MDALQDDAGDGTMQCTEHPFKNTTPAGGICAFCLQEKLGRLVSSSFPITVFPSSSSSSPSFRSDIAAGSGSVSGGGGGGGGGGGFATNAYTAVASAPVANTQIGKRNSATVTASKCQHHQYYSNRSRMLYLFSHKKKTKDLNIIINGDGDDDGDRSKNLVFNRSKSTVTPRRGGGGGLHYIDNDENSPYKRGFWSFISRKTLRDISSNSSCASGNASFPAQNQEREIIVVEENEIPCQTSFDRKVSRSRSVGCGSRSFSGDFFERISTGFGDCTLRRVESQRAGGQDCIKERVRCGGLFSGFMITSSSSSSSSSSYWIASNPKDGNSTGKVTSAVAGTGEQHSRSRSWGWALASPMRAFSKPSSSSRKKENSNKNHAPNLSAIPSLLSVGS